MSTIKSSDEHLTLNADGSSKDIKFQANGVEKASISSAGAFTSTTIDATKLTGTIPNFTSTGIDDNADATAITISSDEKVGIGVTNPTQLLQLKQTARYTDIGLETTNRKYVVGVDNTTSEWYVYDDNASAFRIKMDSTGAVTMPYQPSFRAYKTATNTGGGLDWNGTYHNTGSHFNASTGKFTAPVDGVYLVTLYYLTDSNTDQSTVYASINGNTDNGLKMRNATSSAHETTSVSGAMYLSANDYITPSFSGNGYIYGDSSKSWTQFSAHLLG